MPSAPVYIPMSASVTHLIPLMRDCLATLGSREVGRAAVANALSRGESIALVPGGQAEMFLSRSKIAKGADAVHIIRRHKGFVRMALMNGTSLVPMYSFGETELMDNIELPAMQEFFKQRLGFPIPFIPMGTPFTLCCLLYAQALA